MDKQEYEKLLEQWSIVSNGYYDEDEEARVTVEERAYDYVHDFIESQKPLGIVEGGLYRVKKRIHVNHKGCILNLIIGDEIKLKNYLDRESETIKFYAISRYFGYIYEDCWTFMVQFNQHNFELVKEAEE